MRGTSTPMQILPRLLLVALPAVVAGRLSAAELDGLLDRASSLYAEDRVVEAIELLVDEVRAGAAALPDLTGEVASARADELEVALLLAGRWAREMGNPAWFAAALQGVDVAPLHGALHARIAWLTDRADIRLGPLVDWRLCGPFDNERGQGMLSATPAERDPGAEAHDGKVREVVWRTMPGVPPGNGVLRLRRLFDPHAQSAFVLRTWVESDVDREVLLLLGASEEVRVWCAGELVLEALGEHAFEPDSFCVRLSLRGGWTELLVKVGSLDGSPNLVARFAEPGTGAPLRLAVRSEAPDGVAPLVPSDPGGRAEGLERAPRPGAATRYADAADAESLWRRALLVAEAPDRPLHLRPGLEDVERARALRAPASLRDDLLRLELIRERGASRVEEDVNPWLRAVHAALAEHGALPRLLRLRARHAWQNQPTYARAVADLRRARRANPGSVPARMELSMVLNRMGQGALAEGIERELLADAEITRWPEVALRLARRVPRGERRDELLAAAVRSGEGEAIERLAENARLAGERSAEATLEVLAKKLEHHPWSTTARRAAAQTLLVQGHAREALAVLAEALELAPERAALHAARARAHLALGETELAISALEDELAVDYGADDERRLLEHLQRLGATPFHEPFREPLDALLARLPDRPAVDPSVAGREVLLSRVVVQVNPDGTAKRYHRMVERVLSEAGARELDRRAWRVWPGEEEIRVLTADVRRPDGRVEPARTGRTGPRGYLGIDLPPLEAGDVVDLEWRHDDLTTTFFGNYFGFEAALSPDLRLPVRESEVVLIVPDSYPVHLHQRGFDGVFTTERGEGTTTHRWRVTDLEPRPAENLMPPPQEDAPTIQASSYGSWDDFGSWWWNLIEDEIRVSPEMAAKVAELVAGEETPLGKLRAVYDFVVTDIRYNAWEFGVHGYRPYSAPVIFSRRFGDCKDKAILLRAMLSEVDIEAWPVLIRAEGRRFEEDHTLALVSHFNHCIAYVPAQEGVPEMFLDGTARLHPLEVLPDSDRGAKVVVVRDDSIEPARIPFSAPEANRLEEKIRVDLTVDGPPAVELVRRARGRWDPRERYRFTGSEEERAETAERMLGGLFGALAGEPEAEYPDLEDLGQEIDMRFEVTVEKVSRPTEDGFELPTSFDELELLRSVASETERETDLLLDVPWSRASEVEYVLGEGQRLGELPAPVAVETPDARYERAVEATPTGVRVKEEFTLKTHRVPRDRYAAFRELCRAVDEAQGASIEVEVGQ